MLKLVMMILLMMFMSNHGVLSTACMIIILFNMQNQYHETGKISYMLMSDPISFWVANLSFWIIALVMMIKVNNPTLGKKITSSMMMILTLTFHTWNFLSFFIMFETSMVVMIILVMSWGYQPERGEATMFMVLMTSMFSLPFFYNLMTQPNNLNFWFMSLNMNLWDYLSFMFIFMVKMPVYFLHVWLPKIHVESPIQGSMILAAIMLKLGCYGLIRMAPLGMTINFKWEANIMALSLWTAITLSVIANIQADLKKLIAYSSIVHMTTTFTSITLTKSKSLVASMIIMVGHGLCSSALFFTCNQMYKHSKSRSTLMNKGILTTSPLMVTMWFLLCMSNAPMPPSINILGELLMFKMILTWSGTSMSIIFLLMFASSCYSIVMFCIPAHGKFTANSSQPMVPKSKNILLITLHITVLTAISVKSNLMEI